MTDPLGLSEFICNTFGDPALPTTPLGAADVLINRSAEYIHDKLLEE